jgi:1,4-alpha-glucan branching enzyme
MSRPRGKFLLVLHSHLPFVLGHGRWPHGTDWLAEAAVETYIPLLGALRRLGRDGITPRITVGITPVLAEQLAHPDFAVELRRYVAEKRKVAAEDAVSFRSAGERSRAVLAERWVANLY